ncbi:family 20 glycosylhydrolase [Flavobacterium sp. TAB 87]|uniref:family 20 glycosylhydrolase n=1 Tax=Flavobacterium sp. TAB 87 TaxID=1729581 RepID=UPI00076C1EFB|nr:family 20 glycosylhydrolase [Flavobacterium sp. TAB 87]KVV13248.1 Beta-hexosaminidase [Flavobacterium sp. TAB 87]
MKKIAVFLLFLSSIIATSQEHFVNRTIIPMPNLYKTTGDSLTISGNIKIIFEGNKFSAKEVQSAMLFQEAVNSNFDKQKAAIKVIFKSERISSAKQTSEAYKIEISPKEIRVTGQEIGLFYAVQSLLQLLPNEPKNNAVKIPCVTINDEPRYSYRGLHLDVSRHFFSTAVIKDFIDQMAYYKLNNFHWHLTDDQGWRIEIKKYPKLTEIGSKRDQTLVGNKFERFPRFFDNTPYGGFYTQEEVKEIVKYAESRYVNIIPEIEMPGHASAAVAAYPNLACFPSNDFKVIESWGIFEDVFCAGKEETFTFLEDVLEEVMMLFPSTYIHIGGDECPKTRWEKCPNCQNRIKKEGLKNEHELQSYFIKRIEKYLNANGRQIFGWDEILEGGLAPNAAVMSWRGESGGIAAARDKHDVIMTPEEYVYFDHNQGYSLEEPLTVGRLTTVEEVYRYNPTPADSLTSDQQKYIKGVQGNLWSEYLTSPAKLNYMLYPRIFALAEIAWTETSQKNYTNFVLDRIPFHLGKLDMVKRLYKVPTPFGIKDTAIVASKYELNLKPTVKNGQIFYTIDGYNPDETANLYKSQVTITVPEGEHRIIKVVQISESGRRSSITKIAVTNSKTLPALVVKPKKKGLKYKMYHNLFQQTIEMNLLKPAKSGIHEGAIEIEKYKSKENRYLGLQFEGYIYISETDTYTFSTIADDGATVVIDNQLIVDNDGRHWINEAFGASKLEKGFHKININYFNADGSSALQCFIQQQGKEKQEISASQLFYE